MLHHTEHNLHEIDESEFILVFFYSIHMHLKDNLHARNDIISRELYIKLCQHSLILMQRKCRIFWGRAEMKWVSQMLL